MEPLTPEQLKVLMAPLSPARVKSRSQGGRSLSYLEAYDVRATLIRVFGFGGFSIETLDSQVLDIDKLDDGKDKPKVTVLATARVQLTIPQLGVVYSESAAASQTGRDPGEVADFAIKTAVSDALKRCAINLGTAFGLSLYNNGSTDEVVRRIFAPGQEWPAEPVEATAEQQKMLQERLGAKVVEEEGE